jgi:hypothetical protein
VVTRFHGVTVGPSGFIINSPVVINTTAGASNTNVQIASYRLAPPFLNAGAPQAVRGGLTVDVEVESSDTNVGAITTCPLTFDGGTGYVITQFDPANPGTTTISVASPAGFDTPSNFREITATVNP